MYIYSEDSSLRKERFSMINCVIVACVIAIASFFAFFGASITYPSSLDIDSPSMFKLMFGYTEEAYGYKVEMKACTGLTILFVIEILIIVLAIVALLIAYKSKNGALFSDDNGNIYLSNDSFFISCMHFILCYFGFIWKFYWYK